jgi:hypothetical protein
MLFEKGSAFGFGIAHLNVDCANPVGSESALRTPEGVDFVALHIELPEINLADA